MGGIFKFVLFMLLAMAIFTPPGKRVNALECMVCEGFDGVCTKGEGKIEPCTITKPTDPLPDVCVTATALVKTDGKVYTQRGCGNKEQEFKDTAIGKCKKSVIVVVSRTVPIDVELCICNTDGCIGRSSTGPIGEEPSTNTTGTNSAYLNLTPCAMFQLLTFSLGVIIYYGFTE